MGKNSILNR